MNILIQLENGKKDGGTSSSNPEFQLENVKASKGNDSTTTIPLSPQSV